ncbi:hypothetical protein OC835_007573 [Tilletia horrida]|nr:hypothetical protein OC835_007573 [Tilletia horrida]
MLGFLKAHNRKLALALLVALELVTASPLSFERDQREALSTGSLYPDELCQKNASCVSGRCSRTWLVFDDSFTYYSFPDTDPARCEHLTAGESGCRTFRDCTLEICKDGVCEPGQTGDRCSINYQCKDLCGLDGRCFKPSKPSNQGAGEPCKASSDCLSNTCESQQDVARPLLTDPSMTAKTVDTICSPSPEGRGCHTTSDCEEGGVCELGICTVIKDGEP